MRPTRYGGALPAGVPEQLEDRRIRDAAARAGAGRTAESEVRSLAQGAALLETVLTAAVSGS